MCLAAMEAFSQSAVLHRRLIRKKRKTKEGEARSLRREGEGPGRKSERQGRKGNCTSAKKVRAGAITGNGLRTSSSGVKGACAFPRSLRARPGWGNGVEAVASLYHTIPPLCASLPIKGDLTFTRMGAAHYSGTRKDTQRLSWLSVRGPRCCCRV